MPKTRLHRGRSILSTPFSILVARRPVMYNLSRSELQSVLDVTVFTDRVTNQLNTLTEFAVTDDVTEQNDALAPADMFLPGQMDVMVQSWLTDIGTSAHQGRANTGFDQCIPQKS